MALLAACGGGGGGGGTATVAPAASGWVQGQYLPESNFAALCLAPRTGTDPGTGKAYVDRPGTALDEKNWLRSWSNDLYLWFDEITDQNPSGFASDSTYFDALKTMSITPSGKPKDQFHFTYPTAVWESLSQSGVQAGYGAKLVVLVSTPPRSVVVAFTEPGSPAASAPASLARGAQILDRGRRRFGECRRPGKRRHPERRLKPAIGG